MTEEQIKAMAERFLQWKLPADFSPDAGISFKATFNENTAYPGRHKPTGTNLLTMRQAVEMVRHMVAAIEAPVQEPVTWVRRHRHTMVPYFAQPNAQQTDEWSAAFPVYTTPQPDETAALRAKLAEVEATLERTKAAHLDDLNGIADEMKMLRADRDEERKLADDLAHLHNTPETQRILGWDARRDAILARHAARRKEQQG